MQPDCVLVSTSQVSSEDEEWWCCTWTLWGLCKTAKQKKGTPAANISECVMFICTSCACTHLISVDFCPYFAVSLQRKTRESMVERQRGNWSPTTPDLSDGKRRQHLVIAPFGISFLPFSVRLLYNRMSNLPLAERRECLSSPAPPETHTHLSYKGLSTSLHVTAWPLHKCDPLTGRLFDLLHCLRLFPLFPSGVKWSPALVKYMLSCKDSRKRNFWAAYSQFET